MYCEDIDGLLGMKIHIVVFGGLEDSNDISPELIEQLINVDLLLALVLILVTRARSVC
jgi:copper homeostasis protein CutC